MEIVFVVWGIELVVCRIVLVRYETWGNPLRTVEGYFESDPKDM